MKEIEDRINSIQEEMSGLNLESAESIARFNKLQQQLIVLSDAARRLSTDGFKADDIVSNATLDKIDDLTGKMESLEKDGKKGSDEYKAFGSILGEFGDIAQAVGVKASTASKASGFLSRALSVFKKGGKGGLWGIIAFAAIEGLKSWISHVREAREEAEKLKQAKIDAVFETQSRVVSYAARNYAEAKVELEGFLRVARDSSAPLQKQREAYEALNTIVPGFNSALDQTADGYDRNTMSLEEYLKKLDLLYKYKASEKVMTELYEQQAELEAKKGRFEVWLSNANKAFKESEKKLGDKMQSTADKYKVVMNPYAPYFAMGEVAGSGVLSDNWDAKDKLKAAQKGVADVTAAISLVNAQIAEVKKIRDKQVEDGALDVNDYSTPRNQVTSHTGGRGGGKINTGPTAAELANEALRRQEELARAMEQEKIRENEALAKLASENEEYQNSILEDGYAKRKKILDKQHKDRMDELAQNAIDEIATAITFYRERYEEAQDELARNNENYKIVPWDDKMLNNIPEFQDFVMKINDSTSLLLENETKSYLKSAKDLFSELVKDTESYEGQLLKIKDIFEKTVAALKFARKEAVKNGDADSVARIDQALSRAQETYDKDTGSIKASKWAKDNDLESFFGDLNGQSRKALRAMRKRLNTRVGEEGVGTEEKSDLNKRAKKIDNALRAGKIDTAQYISQQAGEAKDLVGKLEEQGIFGKGDAGKRIGAAFDAAASAGEAYAKFMQGDFVGALSSGLDAVLDLFTVFGIGKGNMAELQEEIDHLTGATQDLTQAFSKLKENLDESNTLTARENYEKAKANVLQREQNLRQTMIDRLRQWERGSHSLGAKVNENSSAQSALAQMGLSSIYDLTSLSPERIQQLATDYSGGAWTVLMDALRDANSKHNGDAEAFIEELTQYAGLTKELEELTDELQEKVTGISFEGFKGNFVSMLQDLSKDIDDFAADTEDQFNKISVQRIADNYEGELRALYDDWAEAAEDGLTEDERRSLEARKADIAQRALDERQAAIVSGLISTSAERKAGSTKGFGSMNSEQADELNGRFTALQVSNQGILNSVVQSAASLAAMSGSFSASAETLQSLQMLAVARNSHLEDISAFCKNISARVDAIEGYSKTTSEKL